MTIQTNGNCSHVYRNEHNAGMVHECRNRTIVGSVANIMVTWDRQVSVRQAYIPQQTIVVLVAFDDNNNLTMQLSSLRVVINNYDAQVLL